MAEILFFSIGKVLLSVVLENDVTAVALRNIGKMKNAVSVSA